MTKINVPEMFGSLVFDDRVMHSRLSADPETARLEAFRIFAAEQGAQ